MTRIGLLSDTHSDLDPKILETFADCDEIWHAGDIGSLAVAQQIAAYKPLRAVHGNIDGSPIRLQYPKDLFFTCQGVSVWITHIGGHPQRYAPQIRQTLQQRQPDLFVCGHSHILRVVRDPALPKILQLNPGAAGYSGHHVVRTALRFSLTHGKIHDMQALEFQPRWPQHQAPDHKAADPYDDSEEQE